MLSMRAKCVHTWSIGLYNLKFNKFNIFTLGNLSKWYKWLYTQNTRTINILHSHLHINKIYNYYQQSPPTRGVLLMLQPTKLQYLVISCISGRMLQFIITVVGKCILDVFSMVSLTVLCWITSNCLTSFLWCSSHVSEQ